MKNMTIGNSDIVQHQPPQPESMEMLSGPASNNPQKSCGLHLVVSLNYCSQNGGNLYRAPYYNGNPNIGPRIIGKKD